MNKVNLSFDVESSSQDTDIVLDIQVLQQLEDSAESPYIKTIQYNPRAPEPTITIPIDDIADADYTVKIIMSGKKDLDTKINSDGDVLSSTEISITNFKFDNYLADSIIGEIASYTHDNNGYGEMHEEIFDFVIGCNGEVKFKFSTPLYLWLLRNTNT